MAKVSVTLEFDSVEAAIAALGKQMVGAPGVTQRGERGADKAKDAGSNPAAGTAPTTRSRKPRADAGKPRGPYKDAEAAKAAAPATTSIPPSAGSSAVTDPSNAGVAATSTSTPADPVPVASAPNNEPAVTIEDCRARLEKLFDAKGIVAAQDVLSRFGVKRAGDMKPEQYADFIQHVNEQIREAK